MEQQIKEALEAIKGQDWSNFDNYNYSNTVYEYDHLTENNCDIIAQCKTEEQAHLIANAPEWLRYLIGEVERLQEIEKEYKELTGIMDRARKLAFQQAPDEGIFYMDKDGNLCRKGDSQ